jgi:hypothetical protein
VTIDDDAIRRVLADCRRSMKHLGERPGLTPFDGRCVLDALAREGFQVDEDDLREWATLYGGALERRQPPMRRGHRPGQRVARVSEALILRLWLPADRFG